MGMLPMFFDFLNNFPFVLPCTFSVLLYWLVVTFDFLCNPISYFNYLFIEICTFKNYKKLILREYATKRFKYNPIHLYFFLKYKPKYINKFEG